MTSHNATRNAHDVIWGWQRQRRTCYRVQYRNVAWCSIYECLFELSSTTNILHYHLVHNKNTFLPTINELYVSLACFERDIFRSKYARRVRPWSFSMLCRWRHWGRGMHLLPLQRHTCESSLSTWLPMPVLRSLSRPISRELRTQLLPFACSIFRSMPVCTNEDCVYQRAPA